MNICPKCGSHNNTTAGGCADCGWNPVYYSNTRPIEDALNKRIAELEAELSNKKIEYTDLWDDALALQARAEKAEAMVEKLNDLIDELVNAGNQPRHRNWQDNWDAIVYRIIKEREE